MKTKRNMGESFTKTNCIWWFDPTRLKRKNTWFVWTGPRLISYIQIQFDNNKSWVHEYCNSSKFWGWASHEIHANLQYIPARRVCHHTSLCKDIKLFSHGLFRSIVRTTTSKSNTVTPKWARLRIKSTAPRVFTQLFVQAQIKENIKLRVTALCVGNSPVTCEGNSPVTGEFHAQSASNTDNASIWWRHRGYGGIHTDAILYMTKIM